VTTPATPPPPRTPVSVVHAPEAGPARSRISWGAVIAGTVMAIIVIVLLQLFMLWLGFTAIDPAFERRPFEGVGTGAAIGLLITTAIALFVGGLVAGRTANLVNSADVILHGLLTWAVVTLVSAWFAATAIGMLVSGAIGVVGQGLGALGQGAAAVAPALAEQVEAAVDAQGGLLTDVQEEMEPLWTDPTARRQLQTVVTRILRTGGPTVSEADQQELVTIVATHTDLSTAEANARVNEWVARYEEGQQALAQAEAELREAGQAAADALARASMWAVIGLIVGAVITVIGARAGAPGTRLETRTP
jgi:hypothetical protein